MKYCFSLLSFFLFLNTYGQLEDKEIRDLKTGRVKNDTSYIYWLPYQQGKRYLFIQGANSNMSHRGELSFDFKMKSGSPVCASRKGKVIATKSDSDKGGLKEAYLNDGNHIIIQHEDGSTAYYWHLKKDGVMVKTDDWVAQGQLIGYSGNTGYTAFPHLHFQVINNQGTQVLPRFQTRKGILYLRPGRWYKSVHI